MSQLIQRSMRGRARKVWIQKIFRNSLLYVIPCGFLLLSGCQPLSVQPENEEVPENELTENSEEVKTEAVKTEEGEVQPPESSQKNSSEENSDLVTEENQSEDQDEPKKELVEETSPENSEKVDETAKVEEKTDPSAELKPHSFEELKPLLNLEIAEPVKIVPETLGPKLPATILVKVKKEAPPTPSSLPLNDGDYKDVLVDNQTVQIRVLNHGTTVLVRSSARTEGWDQEFRRKGPLAPGVLNEKRIDTDSDGDFNDEATVLNAIWKMDDEGNIKKQ